MHARTALCSTQSLKKCNRGESTPFQPDTTCEARTGINSGPVSRTAVHSDANGHQHETCSKNKRWASTKDISKRDSSRKRNTARGRDATKWRSAAEVRKRMRTGGGMAPVRLSPPHSSLTERSGPRRRAIIATGLGGENSGEYRPLLGKRRVFGGASRQRQRG